MAITGTNLNLTSVNTTKLVRVENTKDINSAIKVGGNLPKLNNPTTPEVKPMAHFGSHTAKEWETMQENLKNSGIVFEWGDTVIVDGQSKVYTGLEYNLETGEWTEGWVNI